MTLEQHFWPKDEWVKIQKENGIEKVIFGDQFTFENVVKGFTEWTLTNADSFSFVYDKNKKLEEKNAELEKWNVELKESLKEKELIIEKQKEQIVAAELDAKIHYDFIGALQGLNAGPEIVLKIAGFSVSFLKNPVEIIAAGFKPDFNLLYTISIFGIIIILIKLKYSPFIFWHREKIDVNRSFQINPLFCLKNDHQTTICFLISLLGNAQLI